MSLEKIKERILESKEFAEIRLKVRELQPGSPLILRGAAGSLLAFVAADVFQDSGRQVLLIASDEDRAERLRDDVEQTFGINLR